MEKDFEITIDWRPFELHPEFPPEGAVVHRDPERTKVTRQRLLDVAHEAGLEMQFRDRVSSSRLALEASAYARSQGCFDAFHRHVFQAYWRDGRDIGDKAVLLEAGESSGLSSAGLAQVLEQRSLQAIIDEQIDDCHRLGITAVPSFVFDSRILLEGVRPYEVFTRVMQEHVLKAGRGNP